MGDQSWEPTTRATVQKIPLLTVKAGPRDKDEWGKRLKEVCCVAIAAGA
jgi:ufm1-conjugating enzyme 1